MTTPTAWIFECERAGVAAGTLAETWFGGTPLESQTQRKNAANNAWIVKLLTVLNLRHFYRCPSIMSVNKRYPVPRGAFMAIQDYVRSIAATERVSKDQVFRFLEMQFARADRNHDGELDADELAAFVHAVSKPEADQR
jgi:hypothetical protein